MMGTLIKGLGADHVVWGTDALWTGSPQWQIEGLRRLEIPEDMQKKYGFAPLGPADGPVKSAIFGDNSARLYGYNRHAELRERPDRYAVIKAALRGARPRAQQSALRLRAQACLALNRWPGRSPACSSRRSDHKPRPNPS